MAAATLATVMAMVATAAAATVATATAGMNEVELLGGGGTHRLDGTYKVQVFTGKGVIEIHHHDIFLHFEHRAIEAVAIGVHHRNGIARENTFVIKFTIDLEHLLVKFQDMLLVTLAVSVVARNHKIERKM